MSYDLEESIGFKINQTANKINNKFLIIICFLLNNYINVTNLFYEKQYY